MTWSVHVDTAVNKSKQRLHLLRKLRQFNVSEPVLSLYYRSTIESVISYCLLTWHSNIREKDMKRIKQILNQARKIIGSEPRSIKELYNEKSQKKVRAVMQDPHHPLHTEFKTLRSGHRLQMPRCRTERFRQSFVPSAIRIFNM